MLADLLSLFYPDYCYKCQDIIPVQQKYFCFKCDQEIQRFDNSSPLDNLLHERLINKLKVYQASAYFIYQKNSSVQELIHDLKYAKMIQIGLYYGQQLGKSMLNHLIAKPDLIMPVPLHRQKQKSRGYNQAVVIARGLSQVLEIPVLEKGIHKHKVTQSQTKLTRLGRSENVSDVFSIDIDLEGRHVLLVDDILTTGATLEAFGNTCIRANSGKISAAVMGIAI